MAPCVEDGSLTFSKHIRSSRAVMFRLLKHPALTDVVLVCRTISLPAHRILLAICSPYLKEMLIKEEVSGSRPYRLSLPDVDKSTAEIILEFVYTGRLNVSSKNFAAVSSAMEAAHQLQVHALYRRCSDLIATTLTPTNVTDVWELGERCGDDELADRSADLLARQLETRYKTTRYLSLPLPKFQTVMIKAATMSSQSRSTDSLMRAALAWVKHDQKARSDLLAELLRCIQDIDPSPRALLDLIPAEKEAAESVEIVRETAECAGDVVVEEPMVDLVNEKLVESVDLESSSNVAESKNEIRTQAAIENLENNEETTNSSELSQPQSHYVPMLLLISVNRVDRVVLEMFDLSKDKWLGFREDKSANKLFIGSASTYLGPTIFFFGGESKSGEKLATCVAFQVTKFYPIASMKLSKAWAAAGHLEDMLYCVGGQSKYSYSLGHVERYCPNHDTWKIVAPLRRARANSTVASAAGHLFAFGGMDGSEWINACEMYDPEANEWTEIMPLPNDFVNCQLRCAVYEDEIFVLRSQLPKFAARMDADELVWATTAKFTGDLPRRVQVLNVFGEQIYAVDDKRQLYVYYLHSQLWEKIRHSPGPDGCTLIYAALVGKNDVLIDGDDDALM